MLRSNKVTDREKVGELLIALLEHEFDGLIPSVLCPEQNSLFEGLRIKHDLSEVLEGGNHVKLVVDQFGQERYFHWFAEGYEQQGYKTISEISPPSGY